MAETTLNVRLLHPYKTEAQWLLSEEIPKSGEILYTSGGDHDGWYKIGDGTHTWSGLSYCTTTDTKNTAGSTNSASKLFLVGATGQTASAQTYSNSNLYYSSGLKSIAETEDDVSRITQTAGSIQLYVNDDDADETLTLSMSSSGISLQDSAGAGLTVSNNSETHLTNVVTPTNNGDAANKKYVDDSISGISYPVTSVNGQTGAVSLSIPAAQVQSDWNASSGMGVILNKPTNVSSFTNDAGYLTLSTLPSLDGSITLDTEWEDIYSDWAAGYYYDPDNDYAYTQIPSTETTWGVTETYISTSCTPYTNMIPVKAGEEWRYANMPVHFDSKNKEVPSIIIFDSNKDAVIAYTRTFQDEYTDFTIPDDGVWMAVVYSNSQSYVLQKKVAKRLDKEALLDTIKTDYRAYSLTVPPTTNTLTKAYICLGTDDLRAWETKNLHTLFTTNDIPYYMAAIPEAIKQCVTDDPYKTNLDYMRLCVAAGGEIVCHSADWITEQNKNDFDTMYKYFCKGKEELEHYGFKIRGIFKAGGDAAIYGSADPAIDMWAVHYFEYGDDFTTAFPYVNGRTMLEDWADYSGLTTAIQNAVQNHTAFIGTFHYYNASAETAISTILSALSGYTEGVDYEFVTPSQLYDAMMPTTRPSGGGGGGSSLTYSLSILNNVITLTGSNGSTSSVTLPVYNGGVT